MKFKLAHCNINVTNLEKSIQFYEEALGLHVVKRMDSEDNAFILCYLSDDAHQFEIELTWLKEHPQPYELGENESHIAFICDDYDKAYKKHKAMNCICFENPEMGIYFINDPDDYWLEIIPA